MNQVFNKTLLATALAMAITPVAYATNGMAPIGVGQTHKAMGGAAVASPHNTMSMGTNPASASFIANGFDVGLEVFAPKREASFPASIAGPMAGTYDANDTAAFLVPEGGYKKSLSNGLSLGVVVYGNGGMNTDYKPAFPGATGTGGGTNPPPEKAGMNFMQVFVSPTISKKFGDNHSVGLSVNLVAQSFESTGIITPGSTDADTATGVGATIGYMGKLSSTTMVGFSHRMKTSMGGFDENAPLFNGATSPNPGVAPGTVTDGTMDVPGATTLGVSFDLGSKTTVAMDLQRIHYSKVDAIHDGFSWDDQDVVKLGVKHQLNNKVALLAGVNYGESVVTPKNAMKNVLAPAVIETHLTLGADVALKKNSNLSVVYMHAFENTVTGVGNTAALTMSQDSIGVGYSKKF